MQQGRMLSKTRCLKIVENFVSDKVGRVATTLVSDGAVVDDEDGEEEEEQEVKVKMVTEVTAGW